MPEGPEIHRAANRIAKALVGKTLNQVEFHYKSVEGLEHYFLNKEVEYVKARSKGLLISVGDYVIYNNRQLFESQFAFGENFAYMYLPDFTVIVEVQKSDGKIVAMYPCN